MSALQRALIPALAACCLLAVVARSVAADMPESFGLVAHWSFDRDFASSVNNDLYAGTPHGGDHLQIDRAFGAARVGEGALRFNTAAQGGEPAYVSIANPPSGFGGNAVLTISAWFKLADPGANGTRAKNFVWETVPNSALSFDLATVQRRKVAQFRFRSENFRVFADTDGPRITPNGWHHVVSIWNARAGRVRVYMDGVLWKEMRLSGGTMGGNVAAKSTRESAAAEVLTLEPVRALHLGGNKVGDGVADWDGWLDDVAIFDIELTARQVAAMARGMFEGIKVSAANVLTLVPEPESQRLTPNGRTLPAPTIPAPEDASQGPLIGHVSEHDAVIWARVPAAGKYTIEARSASGHVVSASEVASEANDWCLKWHLANLRSESVYQVSFALPAGSPYALKALTLRTPPPLEKPQRVTLGFGSCMDLPDNSIWTRMAQECPDGMVLLGDTPYIDSTNLRWMRWAYRRFASVPKLAEAFHTIPFWATWDDHDFGRNNSDGRMPHKENARQSFVEYRPLLSIGENGLGAYTSFRRGAVEVFLLDTRWFSRTEPSWADPSKLTLLGRQQWEWLQRGLGRSTAPFKILACGVTWERKDGSDESDAWGSYMHEREALFRWLGEKRISGVVLIGGDVHVSRLVRFSTRETVGYDLYQFISSPMHDRVFPQANAPDPNLIASAMESWVFLKVSVDSAAQEPVLVAELVNRDGKRFFRQELSVEMLQPPPREK